jgi:predicted MFS family arabinose efflux permease
LINKDVPVLWTKSFLLFIIGNFFLFMSFMMLLPTMPPQAKALGATDFQVGLVTTLFAFSAIIARPFIGFLLESSSRKWLVVVGAIALFLLTITYTFSSMIIIFLVIRFVHGIVWGCATTVNGTVAVELVPSKRIGEGIGYFGLSATIGMIIAPSLGILIYQNFGFHAMITGSTVIGLLGIVTLACGKYHTPIAVQEKTCNLKEFSFMKSLFTKDSWYPAVVTIFTTFGYGSIVTFIVIFGEERGIDQIFLYYFCNAIMATAVRPISGKWFDRKGPWTLIMICAVLTIAGLWILSYTYSVGMLILAGAIFGAGYGSLLPALQAWVLSKTAPEKRGTANGMFYSAIDFGLGLSAILLGVVSSFVDLGTVFQLSSICFVIVILMTLYDFRKQRSQEKKKTIAV